jgi:two-component system response regulator
MENGVEILLVEDNPSDEELTLDALQAGKVTNKVFVVHDGAEALDYIFCTGTFRSRPNHNPKVILLDLKLPKITGLEVLQRIRADETTKMIPVVVMTSSKEERDIIESYKLGVNSYIVKPVDFEQFTNAVQEIGYYWMILNQPPR